MYIKAAVDRSEYVSITFIHRAPLQGRTAVCVPKSNN